MNSLSKQLIAAALLANQAQAAKCTALAMAGGGSLGAWEIGVIYGLAHYGNPQDYYYDAISGISVGAINTAGFAGWAPEEIVETTEYLSEVWNGLTNPDIWVERKTGIKEVETLWTAQSLLDDAPALQTIRDIMSIRSEFKRRVSVSAVDVNTGEFTEFNQKDTTYYDFGQASLGSGSIPGIFPPMAFKGHLLMDGGTVWNINVDSALRQCSEAGATNEEITLDILICGHYGMPDWTGGNSIQNFQAARHLHQWYVNMVNDNPIEELLAYPGVNVRFYFELRGGCTINWLNFDHNDTWCLQEKGRKDAQAALAIGQDNIKTALVEWYASKDLQTKYPYVADYIVDSYGYLLDQQ